MASCGVVVNAEGRAVFMWTWANAEPCPYRVPAEPGGAIGFLADDLTEDDATVIRRVLHMHTRASLAGVVRRWFAVPPDARADEGDVLRFDPARRRLVSFALDGSQERVTYTFPK